MMTGTIRRETAPGVLQRLLTRLPLGLLLAFLVIVLVSAGCSATIHRHGAPPVEGEIVHSDAAQIYVETDDGESVTVPRDDVETIDHPGEAVMYTGAGIGIAFLVGSLGLFSAAAYAEEVNRDSYESLTYLLWGFVSMGVAGIVGGGLAAGGGLAYMPSRDAAERPSDATTIGIAPWVAPDGDGVAGGAGVAVTF